MTKSLDLHGTRHEDVDRLVENFVLMNEAPVTIICGNSEEMAQLVRKVLDRIYDKHKISWHRWKYSEFKILG